MTHRVETVALPSGRLGTGRSLTVHRFGSAGARPKVYVQAALHADETPGLLVAHHLIRRLRQLDADGALRGEVVVVPVANPVGLSQVVEGTHVGRYALDGEGNFNRAFPDLTEAVAGRVRGRIGADAAANVALIRQALRDSLTALPPPKGEVAALRRTLVELAVDADIVLDLHCDMEAVPHLYTGDALWPDLGDLAALLGAQAVLLASESGGTPFDEACSAPWWVLARQFGDSGPIPPACIATTIELRGKADVDDTQAAADADALVEFLVRRGVVAGTPAPLPPARCEATPLAGLARIVAPVSGVIAFHRTVGDGVSAGEPVADIVDPTATDPEQGRVTLRAQVDGLVMARTNLRFAGMGDLIASIAGKEPLEADGSGLLFD